MTTRIIKLSSAGIAAALLLGACTSAGAESPPTSSTAATSSTAPTPTTAATSSSPAGSPTTSQGPVEVPKAATQRTEAGAIAFVRHYLDTFNEVSVAPRPGSLMALAESGCKSCAGMEEAQRYFKKYGQHYASTPTRIDRVASSPEADPRKNPYRVLADVTTLGVGIVNADGKVLRSDRKRASTFSFYLDWREGNWKVSEIKVVG